MKNIFLDSGVITEFLTDNTRQTESATAILTLAELKQIKVFVTPFLYSNLYCRFVKSEGHKKMVEKLRKLRTITRTMKMNNKIINQALNSDIENLDMALQYFTARGLKKIDAIITNEVQAYGHSKIALFTPESFLSAYWDARTQDQK
jgi:predicted nucleic acid-binding protein